MTKAQQVEQIKNIIEGATEISAKIQAEWDFLYEEYSDNPKNVTKEDLDSIISKLKRDGLLKSSEAQKEESAQEPKKIKVVEKENKEEKKGEDEEMAKLNQTTKTKNTGKKNNKKVENQTKKVTKPKMLKMTEVEEAFEFKPFPKTLKTDLGTLNLVTDINSMEDLASAIEEDREIVIANVWVPDMLKTYDYDPMGILDEEEAETLEEDGFPNDLDLLQVTFSTEKVTYAVSLYTEVHTTFVPEGFEPDENGLRNNGFVNFQLYEKQQ